MVAWVRDVLGDEFEQTTLPLGEDSEGELVATLVRALPRADLLASVRRALHRPVLADVDVLYVHGWSDYFFQKRLARFWTARGARFYALDLRKYGRSLRPGQTPGYVTHLHDYDTELDAALRVMRAGTRPRKLVLVGHSMGGLVLALWAARHPDEAAALVLNSPWLTSQLGPMAHALAPVIELQARLRPLDAAPQLDLGFYGRAQEEVADPRDPLQPDKAWRPIPAFTAHAGWLGAIQAGHKAVAAGLNIPAPLCTLLSKKSVLPVVWSDELTSADSVLVVDDIARAALRLGPSVSVEWIPGALHDVFLSRREARNDAYRRLDRWMTGWAAAQRR